MKQKILLFLEHSSFILLLYSLTIGVFYAAYTTSFTPSYEHWYLRGIILILFIPTLTRYIFSLFLAPWYPAVEFLRHRGETRAYEPTVSVLIPAHNEEVGIAETIRSVLEADYPALELIVIDDGSTDSTQHMVQRTFDRYRETHAPQRTLIYIHIPNSGKARALNKGLASATGDIIITIDADSVMDSQAIRALVRGFRDPSVASIAGNVVVGNKSRPLGLIQQLEYLYGFYFKRADAILSAVYIVGGAAAAYRRDVVQKLGCFDETIITEDIELSTRLQYYGYKVRYAADAVIYTEGPSTFLSLCNQRLRWKFGRLLTFYKYRSLFFSVKNEHNTYLSFLVLPTALLSEILLFFEGIVLIIFYAYTLATHDFAPLVFFISMITCVILIQVATDPKARYHLNVLFLAPIAWLIFYIMDFVEYQALIRSIKRLVQRSSPRWQKWHRTGVFGGKQVDSI